MNNENYCNNIIEKLSWLVSQVKHASAADLHSINIHAENFFREFLSILYDWNLTNANAVVHNTKGIDLIYHGIQETVVVQVSSTTTRKKIQDSLDKSQSYVGAHFYFIAITDKLPRYRQHIKNGKTNDALFDAKSLVFNWEHDLLDSSRIIVDAKNSDIDKQKHLSNLADQYFEQQNSFVELQLRPMGTQKARNDYEYNAGAVPFLGREWEMSKLLDFVRGDENKFFLWWAITGPGAAGKTRLAYELQNRLLKNGDWDVVALSEDVYGAEKKRLKLLDLSDSLPGKTLVIIDYVQQHTVELAQMLSQMAVAFRNAPLRVLLLERDNRDENGKYPWLEQISRDYRVQRSCFREKPMELKPLGMLGGRSTDVSPLIILIRAFADRIWKSTDQKELTPLPPKEEVVIWERLKELDPQLERPLFAMLLADAWLHDPNAKTWKREKLLLDIANREWGLVKYRLKPYHEETDKELSNICATIWQVAIVLGANGGNLDLYVIKGILPEHWSLLTEFANDNKAKLRRISLSPEEALLTEIGLLEDGKIPALRPDFLGERLVLNSLENMNSKKASMFFSAILSDWQAAAVFFHHCLTDYPEMVSDKTGLREWFLPSGLDLNEKQTSAYIRLMLDLLRVATNRQHQIWLISKMRSYVDHLENKEYIVSVYNDIAMAHYIVGQLSTSLELYKKTQTIAEKEFGLESSGTATTYDNMAVVYNEMGDHIKALELQEKARAIREKELGKNHPVNVVTFNNIAVSYHYLGNYPRAKKYFIIANKIIDDFNNNECQDSIHYDAESGDNRKSVADSFSKYLREYSELSESLLRIDDIVFHEATHNHIAPYCEPSTLQLENYTAKTIPLIVLWELFERNHDVPKTITRTGSSETNNHNKMHGKLYRARSIIESSLRTMYPSSATVWGNLGFLLLDWKRYDEAIPWLMRAIDMMKKSMESSPLYTPSAVNELEKAEKLLIEASNELDRQSNTQTEDCYGLEEELDMLQEPLSEREVLGDQQTPRRLQLPESNPVSLEDEAD